jgi:hypothetical protein
MEKKTYCTMDPISQAILSLKNSLEDAGYLKEMNLTQPGIDKSFYEVVKAYKLLCEDVDFLHRKSDELEENVASSMHKKFKKGLFAAMAKDPKYKDLV